MHVLISQDIPCLQVCPHCSCVQDSRAKTGCTLGQSNQQQHSGMEMRPSELQRKPTGRLKGVGGSVSPPAGCLPGCFKGLPNPRLKVEQPLLRFFPQAAFWQGKARVKGLCRHVLPSQAEIDHPELCIVHALWAEHKAELIDLLDLR